MIPFCENCKDSYKVKVVFEGEECEVDCNKCTYDRLSRQLECGTITKFIDIQEGQRVQFLDHWHAIENDELDYSFKRGIVKEYQRNYKEGHLIGYSIEIQLLDYHEELDEWDNKLIFTEADANWHDKLYENMKVIVYE